MTLELGFRILCTVAAQGSVTSAQLADGLAIAEADLAFVVDELLNCGLLMRTHDAEPTAFGTTRLSTGPRLHTLGTVLRQSFPLPTVAWAQMRALADTTRETVTLNSYVPALGAAMCVAVASCDNSFQYGFEAGEVIPLHADARGWAILAHLPDAVAGALMKRELETGTEAAAAARKQIQAELPRLRQDAIHVSRGQVTPGAVSIVAPIVGQDFYPSSIVLTVPDFRFDDSAAHDLNGLVRGHARRIHEALQDLRSDWP